MIAAKDFGNNFIWGTASSAYQTEGAYNVDGKGLSIWDVFARTSGKTKGSAEKGCDFYNRYMQDIILMHYLNIRNFRLSIAWSRILPDGTSFLSEKYSVSRTSKELGCVITRLVTSSVVAEIYSILMPVSLKHCSPIKSPSLTPVPR